MTNQLHRHSYEHITLMPKQFHWRPPDGYGRPPQDGLLTYYDRRSLSNCTSVQRGSTAAYSPRPESSKCNKFVSGTRSTDLNFFV